MENQRCQRVEPLFHAALERRAGAERQAFLDGACGDDADLRARVEVLLSAHEEADDFLEGPAVEGSREGPGTSIGPYKLLQEIGEGGMGVVYMAEQSAPVSRKVALKVIKLGMDTKQVIARFEAERQALALMDHPHIARVLDAGATETGRPYFVMELVRGVAIHEYCDKHKLTTEERLGLFVDVCRAVQHAHQKGVIHRDLKPSNVLVTSHDGTPVPKIIDFGVAKATNQRLTERTLFTEFQQIIGTPEYMSPEQAEMSGLDVDTRSDIYALGVLLYKLLTGTTPVDPDELRTAGFEEMTRMIREDEPQAPSTRVSKLGADAQRIAERMSSGADELSRHLRGDLDWIVMKALEKDRTRRYETASAFAQDVQRHLEDRPVEAGPPGATYRLRKFVHRNRRMVAVAAVVVAVALLGLAGTTVGLLRARAEAHRSQVVNASLQDVLAMTDATRTPEGSELEVVLADVREVFGERHATYAAVLDTMSARLLDAGEFERAGQLCAEALDVWTRIRGERHPNVAVARARRGTLLRLEGRPREAEDELREALSIFEGAPDANTAAAYGACLELAELLGDSGEYAEADRLLGRALDLLRSSPASSRFRVIQTLEQRFLVQLNLSPSEALGTLREVYEETRAFYPDDSPLQAVSATGLGNFLVQHGQPDAAEPYLREAVRRFRDTPAERGPLSVAAHDALFQVLRARTDPESVLETDDLLERTIELARPFWGPETTAQNLDYYASRVLERGAYGKALEAVLDAYHIQADAGATFGELEGYRDGLTYIAFKAAAHSGLEPETYERARQAVQLALAGEPEHPAMIAVAGAVDYRRGEYAAAAASLEKLDGPLAEVGGALARKISPGDHAFRALTLARQGELASARAELGLLRGSLERNGANDDALSLLAEVEALLDHPPSVPTDG